MIIKKLFFIHQHFYHRYAFMRSEREQLRYLPQSVKLEEAVNPHLIRITMAMISASVLIFVLWASQANINEVAASQGKIIPEGYVKVVQHLDGGMVTNIHIQEGDLVRKNQILLTIDDGGAKQDLARSKARHYFLEIEQERLRAFIYNRQPDFERFTLASHTTQNIETHDLDIYDVYMRAEKLRENLNISKEALKAQKYLHSKGLTSKLRLLNFKKEVSAIEAEAHRELGAIENEIAQNKETIAKLEQKVSRLELKAPAQGIVQGIKINTLGSVINSGETLMEIVPMGQKLVVETRISPRDIGHVRLGQSVRVKISSYDFSRYGAVEGQVDFISATTFFDEQNNPYYRARITLAQNYVGKDPKRNLIMPGMTVTADIITGEKTILAYLLKPIHLSLKTAFTER